MLHVESLSKWYGEKQAVAHVSFRADPGQIVSLVGPSGSGKSTILRMISGLITPSTGQITIADQTVFGHNRDVPPERRGIGMVFQDYALWPNMTVAENIAFGLQLQRWPRSRIRARVDEILGLVRLDGLDHRYPYQLSGGQQQRVALARSLAPSPRLLLLDEPLASLDTQLREALRQELRELLRRVDVTCIYVTHDQSEALEMSDVIVVLRDGHVEQIGAPTDLYMRPASVFVDGFLGATNLLTGATERQGDKIGVRVEGTLLMGELGAPVDGWAALSIRPETIDILDGGADLPNSLTCVLRRSGFLGGRWHHECTFGEHTIQLFTPGPLDAQVGEPVRVHLPPQHCRILPPT